MVKTIHDAREVSVGSTFDCAWREGGRVTCWGDNSHAQLGIGERRGPDPCFLNAYVTSSTRDCYAAPAFDVDTALSGPSTVKITRKLPLALTTKSVQGVALGTPLSSGVAKLDAMLGLPDSSTDGGCDLSGEHTRSLTWGNVVVVFSDGRSGPPGTLTLQGWEVSAEGDGPFILELPYGLALGASRATVIKRVEGTPYDTLDPDFEAVNSPEGVMFVIDKSAERLTSVSYGIGGCE
jgi:hypothetical protein